MNTFNEFLEAKHPEYLEEGVGSWLGDKFDRGAEALVRGISRGAGAAARGVGRGAKATARGVKTAGENYKARRDLKSIADPVHAAIMSGDWNQIKQAWEPVRARFKKERADPLDFANYVQDVNIGQGSKSLPQQPAQHSQNDLNKAYQDALRRQSAANPEDEEKAEFERFLKKTAADREINDLTDDSPREKVSIKHLI